MSDRVLIVLHMETQKRKRCPRCGKTRMVKFFYRRSDTGKLQSWCKDCIKAGQDAGKKRARTKRWKADNAERHRINNRRYVERLREEALTHYSPGERPACACCGEQETRFLSLDHIEGGGNKDRRARGGGVKFYRRLRQEGWPKGFQTLCYNCNMAKGFWGTCPHQEGAADGTSHRRSGEVPK